MVVFACNTVPQQQVSDDPPDWENISQFQSISAAERDSVWIATVKGILIQISASGNKTLETPAEIEVVHFLNKNDGWAVDRKSTIWQTSDAGKSWRAISAARDQQDRFSLPKQLVFLDKLNGWLLGTFQVWQTTDGGKTWRERFSVSQTSEERVGRLYRGAFVDAKQAWLASSGGVVIHTGDGGETWQTVTPVSAGTDLHDVFFISEKRGWLVGRPRGGIYSTENGGVTWRELSKSPERTYLNSIAFVNDNEGWAVGHRYVAGAKTLESIVLHTADGGRTWNAEPVAERERFLDHVVFFDRDNGWLVGRDQIFYTQDGGKSWRIIFSLPSLTRNP